MKEVNRDANTARKVSNNLETQQNNFVIARSKIGRFFEIQKN